MIGRQILTPTPLHKSGEGPGGCSSSGVSLLDRGVFREAKASRYGLALRRICKRVLMKYLSVALQYGGAFLSGFGAAIAIALTNGQVVTEKLLYTAVGIGMMATGLFHAQPPSQGK